MIKPLFQNVMIVINGSESSIYAAKYGILMAKLYRCKLKAVYVVDTATIKQLSLSRFFIAEESREYEESLSSDGTRYLNYVTELGKSKGVLIDTELRRGSVWSEVVSAAAENKSDLILIGGFESSLNRHDSLLTAYKEILLNANCSVLMVREKMIEQLYKMA